jgi:hypothetical protein
VKALSRSAPVQAAAAFVLAAYLGFALATIRWRRQGLEIAEAVWAEDGPAILCFWHSRISLSPASWSIGKGQAIRALISRSADGQLTTDVMTRLGFPAIRGSARDPRKPERDKGGAQALRDMLRWLRGRHGVAVTPDGPRGPVETMGEGPPLLARMSKAPVLLAGLATRPCIRLGSWDEAVIPLPFARGAIVYDGPFRASANADLEALREDWARRLSAATRAAEAALR